MRVERPFQIQNIFNSFARGLSTLKQFCVYSNQSATVLIFQKIQYFSLEENKLIRLFLCGIKVYLDAAGVPFYSWYIWSSRLCIVILFKMEFFTHSLTQYESSHAHFPPIFRQIDFSVHPHNSKKYLGVRVRVRKKLFQYCQFWLKFQYL